MAKTGLYSNPKPTCLKINLLQMKLLAVKASKDGKKNDNHM